MNILVLGLGNALMSDDALGVCAVERLQRDYRFPDGVKVDQENVNVRTLNHIFCHRVCRIANGDADCTSGTCTQLTGSIYGACI